MTRRIRAEILKLRTTRTALGFAAAVAILTLAIVLLTILSGKPTSVPDKRSSLAVGSTISAVLLLFGVVGAGAEYRHRTLAPALLVAPGRGRLLRHVRGDGLVGRRLPGRRDGHRRLVGDPRLGGHLDLAERRMRQYLADAGALCHHVVERATGRDVFVLGNSLGGLIAAHYAVLHGDTLGGVIMTAPFFGPAFRVPPLAMLYAGFSFLPRLLAAYLPVLLAGVEIQMHSHGLT